jgi:hypothetical protein
MQWLTDRWWKFVFWWKKRTGFMVFGPAVVFGTVISKRSSSDGDLLLNIDLDETQLAFTPSGIGDRNRHGMLHCEIPPWIRGEVREAYASVQVGDRVRIEGDWGFDGVHLLDEAKPPWWKFLLVEVPGAIFRHQPNVRKGFFEFHPVTKIQKM